MILRTMIIFEDDDDFEDNDFFEDNDDNTIIWGNWWFWEPCPLNDWFCLVHSLIGRRPVARREWA